MDLYDFDGDDNQLFVWNENLQKYIDTKEKIPGLNLIIHGCNNKIWIDDPCIIQDLMILCNGFNHKIHIGKSLHTSYESVIKQAVIIIYCNDCELSIGDNIHIEYDVCISLAEPFAKCKIGDHVRIAEKVRIFAADAHPIIDINTGKVINYGQGKRCLTVGNNCWIGLYSFLGKNTILPDFTIVGAHSVVTKKFDEPYTIIAGNPAKIIKRGVKRIDIWEEVLNNH